MHVFRAESRTCRLSESLRNSYKASTQICNCCVSHDRTRHLKRIFGSFEKLNSFDRFMHPRPQVPRHIEELMEKFTQLTLQSRRLLDLRSSFNSRSSSGKKWNPNWSNPIEWLDRQYSRYLLAEPFIHLIFLSLCTLPRKYINLKTGTKFRSQREHGSSWDKLEHHWR